MKKLASCLVMTFLAAAPVLMSAAPIDEAMAVDFDEMMAMMTKLAQPGPNHAFLAPLAGEWKTETKSWTGPGEPTTSQGSATVTSILGGRFIQEQFKGSFMDKPFEGLGITGFDNGSKQFVSSWCDSMGTVILMSRGTYDEAAKALRMTMEYDNPITGKKDLVRAETRFVSQDNHVFSMYENREGQEIKTMEITYTRK